MFYRHFEDASLVGEPDKTEDPYGDVIEQLCRDMDRIVGRTMEYADGATALFVLSDHGFCSFRRGVNLNAWLKKNGYLHLLDGRQEGGQYLEGVDWSRTRAYTFGLSGLYLNLKSREARGVVSPSEAAGLKAELIAKLEALVDETNGNRPIRNVYDTESIYSGPYRDAAPDLVVGYASGYRASWSGAVGTVKAQVLEDNNRC